MSEESVSPTKDEKTKKRGINLAICIALGAGIGAAAIGPVMHNQAVGIGVGVALGVVFGTTLFRK